ncbi:conserved unknown protein [Ectocarpus siliculosus]|uniref:RING-type domain-containing protein n=1 Tax=Ectocarpus siliculosus TaxID=2880 RepID=D7FYF6_ECTSI|nr:conserved unknown protein [Ectocarpus siliculosus]|eukprot:CBJ32498.1 conserved unknown protein [Ectocarpus siliculosus]
MAASPFSPTQRSLFFVVAPKTFVVSAAAPSPRCYIVGFLVCFDNEVDCTLVPCGHHCCCITCASKFSLCPVCRTTVTHKIKTIPSKIHERVVEHPSRMRGWWGCFLSGVKARNDSSGRCRTISSNWHTLLEASKG